MASLVYLRHKNGTTYVYENVSYWDKVEKKSKSKRKCIGHLDPETKEIKPNGKRGGSRKKVVSVDATASASAPAPEGEKKLPQCHTYSYGVSALLEKAAQDLGLK